MLFPVMPGKMGDLRRALGIPSAEVEPSLGRLTTWGGLAPGSQTADYAALFPRIDRKRLSKGQPAEQKRKPAPEKKKEMELIDIETFGKVDLRTAKVLGAERIEGARKLLKLRIEVGEETRQIVAGVAQHYAPEELVGKTIVIVANLEPAVLHGAESQGMLLAAKSGKSLRLVTVDGETASGASVS